MLNVSEAEIKKFSELAADWWDVNGPQKALHAINPVRLEFIQQHTELTNKKILDVGCGAGILSESLAASYAEVTGIDLSASLLNVAREHALGKYKIDYQCIAIETLVKQASSQFDVITCMEMLEHVPKPHKIIEACSQLIKPGGSLFFSTLNRNLCSYIGAILGAEYVLGILPKGTHDYQQFIKPSELATWLREYQLDLQTMRGIAYNPFTHTAQLTSSVTVNYILYAKSHEQR